MNWIVIALLLVAAIALNIAWILYELKHGAYRQSRGYTLKRPPPHVGR